jgi:RsiW-degrading membrane proteinase PrsW (M82 family)
MVYFPALQATATAIGYAPLLSVGTAQRSPLPSASPLIETPEQEEAVSAPAPRRSARDYLYWILLLALAPLVLAIFRPQGPGTGERLESTLRAHPNLRRPVEEVLASKRPNLDALLEVLPGQRLDAEAFLPRNTQAHWLFAALSATGFFFVMRFVLARELLNAWRLVVIGLFTGTVGVAFLFVVEGLLGASFRHVLDPAHSLLANVLGFTCGVGLCEELCKALPLLGYSQRRTGVSWQGACLWGMASGVGFGIAEAVMVAIHSYNGIQPGSIYLTRFVSCVALHAVWSASVGITVFRCRTTTRGVLGTLLHGSAPTWRQLILPLLRILGVAMVLHGIYDALLIKEMIAPTLLTALLSFAWLAWQIETCREEETRLEALIDESR